MANNPTSKPSSPVDNMFELEMESPAPEAPASSFNSMGTSTTNPVEAQTKSPAPKIPASSSNPMGTSTANPVEAQTKSPAPKTPTSPSNSIGTSTANPNNSLEKASQVACDIAMAEADINHPFRNLKSHIDDISRRLNEAGEDEQLREESCQAKKIYLVAVVIQAAVSIQGSARKELQEASAEKKTEMFRSLFEKYQKASGEMKIKIQAAYMALKTVGKELQSELEILATDA